MKTNVLVALLVGMLIGIPTGVHAKFDCFLRLAGIQGESADAKHKGWIDVLSFEQGVEMQGVSGLRVGGGASASKARHSGVIVHKAVDRTSPTLQELCNLGRPIPEILLECARAGGDKVVFYVIRFKDVVVRRIQTTGNPSAHNRPVEEVTFDYGAIEWRYIQTDVRSGAPKGHVIKGWDLRRNAPIRVR